MLVLMLMAALAGEPLPPPSPGVSVITNPDWISKPTGEDFARLYPDAAARKGVAGQATVKCQVSAAGLLVDCTAVTESPTGEGFGDAALAVAAKFRMRPATKDGVPVAGGTVRIPIRFALPGGYVDPLTTMFACYGETAAAAERDPSNAEANYAFAFFAAQVAVREAAGKTTPEIFEGGLISARKAALTRQGPPQYGPTLAACLGLVQKPK